MIFLIYRFDVNTRVVGNVNEFVGWKNFNEYVSMHEIVESEMLLQSLKHDKWICGFAYDFSSREISLRRLSTTLLGSDLNTFQTLWIVWKTFLLTFRKELSLLRKENPFKLI